MATITPMPTRAVTRAQPRFCEEDSDSGVTVSPTSQVTISPPG